MLPKEGMDGGKVNASMDLSKAYQESAIYFVSRYI